MNNEIVEQNNHRRNYGQHITSSNIFREFIFPEIKDKLYDFTWVDLFCGEGNLILPILEHISEEDKIDFFKKHIFLFDSQEDMVKKCIQNAEGFGIPQKIAKKNILLLDTLEKYPNFIKNLDYPIFHITNPPYLYIGYIVKTPEAKKHLKYFTGDKKGYQDLYQIGLINDLEAEVNKLIYIIPSNFLFGFSVSNKARKKFLKHYSIKKAVIFEKKIFEFTGTNVCILFFEKKIEPKDEIISFNGLKINNERITRSYILNPNYNYRAGNEFEEFVNNFKKKELSVNYYLTSEEVNENKGDISLQVIDVNEYWKGDYKRDTIKVSNDLRNKIKGNILFVRTVDTGSDVGRVGLYEINKSFSVDGILVSKAKYRTYPIQLFFEPKLDKDTQLILKDYLNFILEYLREKTDSEFMTTYRYSKANYTRKYLGLSQTRKLISTFPPFDKLKLIKLKDAIINKDIRKIIELVKNKNSEINDLNNWL
tara:strand:- start:818 stop:2254 length:1437 start_codon:yes stop_codon:yes gene_type:complete